MTFDTQSGARIAAALGLDPTTVQRVTITAEAQNVVRVDAVLLLRVDDERRLVELVKHYELVERSPKKSPR